MDYLRYANQGATRNRPISDALAKALSFLPDLGVTAEIFSGGQPGKESGGKRVGSTRHDHGNAADVRFFRDGRQLDWAREEDRPIFEAIVTRGRENGVTGIGAGTNYMSPGSMHLGFGAPAVWGAGGKAANAPDWLRTAYHGADAASAPTIERAAAMNQPQVASSTSTAPIPTTGAPPMPSSFGGLGGLGGTPVAPEEGGIRGFLRSDGFGDMMQAIGLSMMSSPNTNWLADVGTYLPAIQERREKRDERNADRQSIEAALIAAGVPPEQAAAASRNSTAATLSLSTREAQVERDEKERERKTRAEYLQRLDGAFGSTEAPSGNGVAPIIPVERVPLGMSPAMLQPGSLTDTVPATSAAPRPPATSNTSAASGNKTFDTAIREMDRLADLMGSAPDDESFKRAKARYDHYEGVAERYKPENIQLQTINTEAGEQKGWFDRNNVWQNIGVPKPARAAGAFDMTLPDGTSISLGGGEIPKGFQLDPEIPGALKPIPGGPGDQLPAELAGRIAIADSFLGQAPALREKLVAGSATGVWDRFQAGNNASSDQAGVYRQLQSGADALQRLLTGAGMTENEAAVYAGRYLPTYTDSAESAVTKLDQMRREVENARAAALRGRGGVNANVTPNGAPTAGSGGSGSRTSTGVTWSVD